jgi:3-hydroxymyristoyl/3-hydroxydecanoyl-(acyl carrier protein) dehydratase
MRFLLVDRILEMESGKYATGIKNVTLSEDFLTHHFPDYPIMPGTLIAEALVQLADWVIRESTSFTQMGLATSFERIKFRRLVRPGDQLRLEVNLLSRDGEQAVVEGKAFCDGALVTSVSFTLGLEPLEPLQSSESARRIYRMIALAPGQV